MIRIRSALVVLAAVLAVGCSSTSTPSSPASSPAPPAATGSGEPSASTNWPTYHQNAQRTGVAAGLPPAGRLSLAWSAPLDGEVAGQPLVIGSTVVAATGADTVYALDRSTGKVRWHITVGTPVPRSSQPCGNLDPLGITSTPVYDPAHKLVYVVAQDGTTTHRFVGLRLSDGTIAVSRDIPAPDHEPAYDQQRSALALADGHVYVAFGGHFGDCGPYIGSVVAMPVSGHGQISSYLVPTNKQGGIWAAAGPVVSSSGLIYVSAGNGGRFKPPYDGSNSVIELTPSLHRTGVFAPSNWASLSAGDLDLGAMSPALLSDGRILQVGKNGVGYLLNASDLGGVGGQIAEHGVCAAFGGAAVSGTIVYVPCYGSPLAAVQTAGDQVRVLWRAPGDVWGSPVIGGGALFVAQPSDGNLYELAPGTGQVRSQLHIASELPHFVSPSLSGDLVLVGTLNGVVAVRGA